MDRLSRLYDVEVCFHKLGLNCHQVRALRLPPHPPKRATIADQRWPSDVVAELDAIPPDILRAMVRAVFEVHLPAEELGFLKAVKREERATLPWLIGRAARCGAS